MGRQLNVCLMTSRGRSYYISHPQGGGGYVHAVSGNIPKLSGCGYMGIHLKYIGILPGEVLIVNIYHPSKVGHFVLISYNISKPSRGGCMGTTGLGQHYSH